MSEFRTFAKEALTRTTAGISGATKIGVSQLADIAPGSLQLALQAIVDRLIPLDTTDTPANREVLTYDSASGKYKPSPPQARGAFHAYNTATQSGIVTSTFTKVSLQATVFNVDSWFDTTNSRYTPQLAGYYQFEGGMMFTTGTTDQKKIYSILYKNGVRLIDMNVARTSGTDASGTSSYGSALRVFANGTTDYFELYTFHTFGVNGDIVSGGTYTTRFIGGYVGS